MGSAIEARFRQQGGLAAQAVQVVIWRPRAMSRTFLLSMCFAVVLVLSGCGSSGQVSSTIDYAARVYLDPRGWAISVPRQWYVLRFRDRHGTVASQGVQISDVRLPRPIISPGNPIQVNGNELPARGVGLVIASDTDARVSHAPVSGLPLPARAEWSFGSALAGQPYMQTVWFRVDGRMFMADAKIGARASKADLAGLAFILESIRAWRDRS